MPIFYLVKEHAPPAGSALTFYTAGSAHDEGDKIALFSDRGYLVSRDNPVVLGAEKQVAACFIETTVDIFIEHASYESGGTWLLDQHFPDTDAAIAAQVAAEASAVATAADRIQTAADRVQTGLDVIAANAGAAAATGMGYPTKALMDAAAGLYTEGQVVRVTNDPNPANNGDWIKGITVFTQSSFDRVAVLETTVNANLPSDAPWPSVLTNGKLDAAGTNNHSWLNAPAIQAITEAYLNGIGINHGGLYPADTRVDAYFGHTPTIEVKKGMYVAAAVFIYSPSGNWPTTVSLLNYDMPSSASHIVTFTNSYEQVNANVRRYKVNAKITITGSTIELFRIRVLNETGNPGNYYATGYAIAYSHTRISDVDTTRWDSYTEAIAGIKISGDDAIARITAIETDVEVMKTDVGDVLKTESVNGNMTNFGMGVPVSFSGGPTFTSLVHPFLNARDCNYAATLAVLAANQSVYLKTYPVLTVAGDSWVACSIIINADDWEWLGAGRVRMLLYRKGSSSGNIFNFSTYVAIDANTRRYYAVVQGTHLNTEEIDAMWIEVTAMAGRTAVVRVTGNAVAFSDTKPSSVDWADFDPFKAANHESRLSAVEALVTTPEVSPYLIVPSSLFLLQGRPLEILKFGVTDLRDASMYDVAFVGSAPDTLRPCIRYAKPIADLDGTRLSGVGAVWARVAGADTSSVWKRAVTFYSTTSTKAGSPKILVIGDSLTYRGTLSKMASRLTDAGVTPNFLGTFKDFGGVFGEGRPSWRFTTYTRKEIPVNADGSGITYPIDAINGNGTISTIADYLALATTPSDYAPRWGFNPFIRPTIGGDNPAFVFNGYVFDMRFYLDRMSTADPDIVMIQLGTNDLSNHPDSTGIANCVEALNILYTQTRAALPNAKIAIVLNGVPSKTRWLITLDYFKHVLEVYADREGENIFVLPVYLVQDPKFIYGINVSSTDVLMTQTGTTSDWVHSDDIGMNQWAEMTFAFVMNMI
jgi:hypothetical protein